MKHAEIITPSLSDQESTVLSAIAVDSKNTAKVAGKKKKAYISI